MYNIYHKSRKNVIKKTIFLFREVVEYFFMSNLVEYKTSKTQLETGELNTVKQL